MSKNSLHEHLRSVPLFAELGGRELDLVARATTELELPAGSALMRTGTAAREMFVVVDGTLSVRNGQEEIAQIGPRGFAGELGLLARTLRTFDVIALTDVQVIHIDGRMMSTILAEAPEIAVPMLEIVAKRVIENSTRHTD